MTIEITNIDLVHNPIFCQTLVTGNTGLNVLSLFDGMSCGQIALERAGIKANNLLFPFLWINLLLYLHYNKNKKICLLINS